VFNSSEKNITTDFGEQTTDEMCLGVILTYPAVPGFVECSNFHNLDVCSLNMSLAYPNCSIEDFIFNFGAFSQLCDQTCSSTCKNLSRDARNTRCLNGEVGRYIRNMWPHDNPAASLVLQGMDFCAQALASDGTSIASTQPMSGGSTTSRGASGSPNSAASQAFSSRSASGATSGPAAGASMSMGSPTTARASSGASMPMGSATTARASSGASMPMGPTTQPGVAGQSTTKGPGAASSQQQNNGGQSTNAATGSGMTTTKSSGGNGANTGTQESDKIVWAIPIVAITVVASVSAVILFYLFCFLPSRGVYMSPYWIRPTRYQ